MTRFPGFGYHVERGRRKNKCSGDHTSCYADMSMSVYKILFRQRMDNKIVLIVFVVLAVKSFFTTPGWTGPPVAGPFEFSSDVSNADGSEIRTNPY